MKLYTILILFGAVYCVTCGRARKSRRNPNKNPLHLRSDEIQLTKLTNNDLFKVGNTPNFNPNRARFEEFDSKKEWSGIYTSPNRDVAQGYGSDNFDYITKQNIYHMNNLKVGHDTYAIEVTKPEYGSPNYDEKEKATYLKYYLRDNGLGNYQNQQDKSIISRTDFDKLSNDVKNTFQPKNAVLMEGIDRNGLAIKVPHDVDGGKEVIFRESTLGNLLLKGNSQRVIENFKDVY